MYIAPNTTVRILKGVPLTPDYKDTLYFGSLAEQTNYFAGKTAALLTQQSYVRKERGVIKAEVRADTIYSANYLMYQNSAYGNKWFYAFITSIEYDNNSTAIITFEIDDLQTWLFDFSTPPCLVERCHSRRDVIGDNLVPEPVDPGDLIPNDMHAMQHESDPTGALGRPLIAISYVDPVQDEDKGHLINNVFTTGAIYLFEATGSGPENAFQFIQEVANESFESIISVYMVPAWAIGLVTPILPLSTEGKKYYRSLDPLSSSAALDGYVPRNNKMYTYPYNCLSIYTPTGAATQFRYEFFENLRPTFVETWNSLEPVTCVLRPWLYRNINTSNMDISISLNDYPMCMWSGDAFKAYLAQNKVSRAGNILEILGGLFAAPFTGGISLGATLHGMANLMNSDYKASIAADQRGGQASGNNVWAHDQMDFYASRMSCQHDKAILIDEFFTTYGYAQGAIMMPPKHWRKAFTYVKTDGCIVTGNLPSEAAARIRSIYDNGIRWWADHNNFGNLHIDNYTL